MAKNLDFLVEVFGGPGRLLHAILEQYDTGRYIWRSDGDIERRWVHGTGVAWAEKIGMSRVSLHQHIRKLRLLGVIKHESRQVNGHRGISLTIDRVALIDRVNQYCVMRHTRPIDYDQEIEGILSDMLIQAEAVLRRDPTRYEETYSPGTRYVRTPFHTKFSLPVNPFEDPNSPWKLLPNAFVQHAPSGNVLDGAFARHLLRELRQTEAVRDERLREAWLRGHRLETEFVLCLMGLDVRDILLRNLRRPEDVKRVMQLEPQYLLDLMAAKEDNEIQLMHVDWREAANRIAWKQFTQWWLHVSSDVEKALVIDHLLRYRHSILTVAQLNLMRSDLYV